MIKKIAIQPFGHDSSLVFFDEHGKPEVHILERHTRIKHDQRFIDSLLDELSPRFDENTKCVIALNDVSVDRIRYHDAIFQLKKIGFDRLQIQKKYKNSFEQRVRLRLKYPNLGKLESDALAILRAFKFVRNQTDFTDFLSKKYHFKPGNITYYDHHMCHAAGAYFFAPRDFEKNSLIVTLDGQGDGLFSTICIPEENGAGIRKVADSNSSISFANLYTMITELLGFIPNSDEGKVEALASFRKKEDSGLYHALMEAFSVSTSLEISLKPTGNFPFDKIGDKKPVFEFLTSRYLEKEGRETLAAGVQGFLEDFVLAYIRKANERYPQLKRLVLAGGTFANVKLNMQLFESRLFEDIYIFPAMGDDGTPLGALVLDEVADGKDVMPLRQLGMPYFGPSYIRKEILQALDTKKSKINFEELGQNWLKDLAKEISNDSICASFNGKLEYGPRALGNRSILGNPRNPEVRKLINTKFKRREPFQPFCPSILEEERGRLFDHSYSNKHMTCAFKIKEGFEEALPSIVHVDGTARAQFVTREDNPDFYQLLSYMKEYNEFGVLLNTSFNLHGKAMVMTPEQAIDDYLNCNLDYLFIQGFKVWRK